ncbi:MAG: hypothetical protein QOD42_988 [Sphingomonadales bacterium]|nr:hypothetical protein [Sphingomonadales bacterium]
MAHLYEVHTNQGTYDVPTDHHHDHLSVADFERILVQTICNSVANVAGNLILHRYTYRGRR